MTGKTHSGPAPGVQGKFLSRHLPAWIWALIIAASASGKTTFSRIAGSFLGVVDGDDVVARVLGWPVAHSLAGDLYSRVSGPRPLTSVGLAHHQHALCLRSYAVATGKIVLFNGALLHIPPQVMAAVEVPEELYWVQLEQWRAARRRRFVVEESGRPVGTPYHERPDEAFISNRANVRKQVEASMVFPDFDAAVTAVRLAMMVRKLVALREVRYDPTSGLEPHEFFASRVLQLVLPWAEVLFCAGTYAVSEIPELVAAHAGFSSETWAYIMRGSGVAVFDGEGSGEFCKLFGHRLAKYLRLLSYVRGLEGKLTASMMANVLNAGSEILEPRSKVFENGSLETMLL